jgi:ATPase subunit of ABC transporter with duplicated ATPase domains
MLLSVEVTEKSFGSKILYQGVDFEIQEGEKVGLIGRNGTGKSTLFNVITGADLDYQGSVQIKKGTVVVSSQQEHHDHDDQTSLEYIQGDLPEYQHLTHIVDTYPDTMGSDPRKLQIFSDALERFGQLGYYQIEDELAQAFEKYQLDPSILHRTLGSLSGGQKRMVELIKVQRSRGHLALIDEPTNHMDYIAKATFVNWLKAAKESVLVITHDRDVLDVVDRILEIRDGKSYSFKGNYTAYLRNNMGQITSEVGAFDQTQKRMVNLKEDIIRFQRMKEKARNPGTIRRFKGLEQKARDELAALSEVEKPSFWIDQESASTLKVGLADTYDKYKATNIKVRTNLTKEHVGGQALIKVSNLALGYGDRPLFENVSFSLSGGERVRLHGRNGTGKTTLVSAIMATADDKPLSSVCSAGEITLGQGVRIGHYEQEINPRYLTLTLTEAVEQILRDNDLPINHQRVKQFLSDYLFNPAADGDIPVQNLSGGQKARLQLIAMLATDPQLLILDEPTNHLDLPSIEELENALVQYHGAVLYISHDSFLAKRLGGVAITIGK